MESPDNSRAHRQTHLNALRTAVVPTWFLLLIAALVPSAGCGGQVLEVTRVRPPADPPTQSIGDCQKEKGNPCKLPGIPFYAVGYRCLHTTVWLEPVYAVSLVISSGDKKLLPVSISRTKFFGRRELEAACVANAPCVKQTLPKIQNNPQVASYQSLLDEFKNLPEMDPLRFDTTKILDPNSSEHDEVLLSSNSVAPERYVDADAIYYYNVNKPWSGTANAEIDLSNEGILNKASGQVENKTMETMLSLLPVSDLIKGAAGVAVMGPRPGGAGYKLDLQVQSKVYKHTHFAAVPGQLPPCSPVTSLVGAGGAPFNFTVEDVTEGTSPPSSNPRTDGQKTKDGKPQK
jgi:hypothetical protein